MLRYSRSLIALAMLAVVATPFAASAAEESDAFVAGVDLSRFRLAAVQNDGRVKTIDSLAREMLGLVDAKGDLSGDDAVFAYLDLIFHANHYAEQPVILIKKKPFRQALAGRLEAAAQHDALFAPVSDAEMKMLKEDGRVSRAFVDRPDVRSVLAELDRDVMRTSKEVSKLISARNLTDPRVLTNLLAVIPVPGGTINDRWSTIAALEGSAGPNSDLGGLDDATRTRLSTLWQQARASWVAGDAKAASSALNSLAAALAMIEPAAYPSQTKLTLEHWYYSKNKLIWIWMVYLLSVALLLMASVYRWTWARRLGMATFLLAFGVHTGTIAIRWYLAGRIPNSNMFEAVMASAWLGGLAALVVEFLVRRSALRSLPALGGAVCGMFAMMASNFWPVALDSSIQTTMPILNTIWLYIHTNLVIWSYALITIAAVSATLYLVMRAVVRVLPAQGLVALWQGREGAVAVSGGASALILSGTSKREDLFDESRTGLATVLDGVTMIFMELSFITLWTGIILGALWADVSWGRPWGWDPKEVFALNTWLIFLILVHVRLKVKDKALWTAVLAVIGFGVMLFNWLAVNFVIVGLHSYA